MQKKFLLLTIVLLTTFSVQISAQSFGFGCLGLAGFYAGVSEYRYDVPGINTFINLDQITLTSALSNQSDQIKFEKGTGYRIGANFFRAKWSGFFLSAKGYYQFVKEEKESNASISSQQKYQLNMNNWGVGVDFGTPIVSILDWKILEGNVTFFVPDLNIDYYENNKFISSTKFQPENVKISYFIGTGVILHVVPDYLSLEGTAGYNFLQIEKFKNDNEIFIGSSSENAVKNGGWSATVQINVGFPL